MSAVESTPATSSSKLLDRGGLEEQYIQDARQQRRAAVRNAAVRPPETIQRDQIIPTAFLDDSAIEELFTRLDEDASTRDEAIPAGDVRAEAKRLVQRLRWYLPPDTDVYANKGKVVIELYGKRGHRFSIQCEPGGSALCIISVPNQSRHARYTDSRTLPDGFVKDGLDAVRPSEMSRVRWARRRHASF